MILARALLVILDGLRTLFVIDDLKLLVIDDLPLLVIDVRIMEGLTRVPERHSSIPFGHVN